MFFALRLTLSDLGSLYLLMLGVVAIAAMLKAPKGLWGAFAEKTGFEFAPLGQRVVYDNQTGKPAAAADGQGDKP